MTKISRLIFAFFIFLNITLMLSCAHGPSFVKEEKIPEQKGLVYLYRKGLSGALLVPVISCNGKTFVSLKSGCYYPYFADPGKNFFSAQTESYTQVSVDVEPGKTYYVRLRVGIGFFVGRPHLILVDEEKGAKEIKGCKLQW